MGKLLKSGVINGKKVSIKRIFGNQVIFLDNFVRKCLEEEGVLLASQDVLFSDIPKVSSVKTIISIKNIAILLKLVEIVQGDKFISDTPPKTLTYLNLDLVHRGEKAEIDRLNKALCSDNNILLEWEESTIEDILSIVSSFNGKSKLLYIGPYPEKIFHKALTEGLIEDKEMPFNSFKRVVEKFSLQGNIHTYRALNSLELLNYMAEVESEITVVSYLDLYMSSKQFAQDLITLKKAVKKHQIKCVWLPGILHFREKSHINDEFLLRAISIARIVFGSLVDIRASSKFFSLEGLRLAQLFGANDFGYGAGDSLTEESLGLLPIEKLCNQVNCY